MGKLTIIQIISIVMIILGIIIIVSAIPLVQQTAFNIPGVIKTEMPQTNVNRLVVGSVLVILGATMFGMGAGFNKAIKLAKVLKTKN